MRLIKKISISFCSFVVICGAPYAQDIWVLDSTLVHVEEVIDSSMVRGPWDITWGPDNKLWMSDYEYIKTYDPVTQQLDTVLFRSGENALGLAIHPDLLTGTPYVYVVFDTAVYYAFGSLCNVYRYEYIGNQLTNELLLLSYNHGGEHAGGRMIVSQDDKVLVTTADYWFGGDPLRGRTLRMNLDGTVPSDNPIPGNYEWTYGHRNPQGLVQTPGGNIYNSEHGQTGNDEVNLLVSGGNFGWPAYDGYNCINIDSCSSPTFNAIFPLRAQTAPPSGVDYYNHHQIPEFSNSLLVGTLHTSLSLDAHSLNVSGDSIIRYRKYLNVGGYNRIRDVAVHPDGSVYFIGFDRQPETAIFRLFNPNYNPSEIPEDNLLSFTLYPNPANDQITIGLPESSVFGQPLTITITDVLGKVVFCQPWPESQRRCAVNTASLSGGVYFVTLQNGKQSLPALEKLIINRPD